MTQIRKMNALRMARFFIDLAALCEGAVKVAYLNSAKAEIARARSIVEGA